ncbi:hypothetical protein P4V39_02740, partial [Brevibacillus borstelensis]|uniref:hypothetical protein n=1 Tax=Brevibacillus borstelensis TaxID=45462 RepID=UPI002E1BCD06|nr:hypothetical protein [Brevibacillus borstelensis]
MSSIQNLRFTGNQIEALSKTIGDFTTGSEITRLLAQIGINDSQTNVTKWRRIDFWLNHIQNSQNCLLHNRN